VKVMGRVKVPGDKSIGHRAQMLAAVADGRSEIEGLSDGADVASTRSVLAALGVDFEWSGDRLVVNGRGLRGLRGDGQVLDCGNSGTTIRLLLGLLAGQPGAVTLDGDASLRARPMRRVTALIEEMGGQFTLPDGDRPPVSIHGAALRGACIDTRRASAQVKSAVLFAGLSAEGVTEVTERGLSRDHSERMLAAAGVDVQRDGLTVRLTPPAQLPGMRWRVPGDFSSAAFWLAAAAILPGSDLTIFDVSLNPTRTGFLDALRAMQVQVAIEETGSWGGEPIGTVRVQGGALIGARIDGAVALRALDELPLVAVLGALADGETIVADAAELAVKESDRIVAMRDGLRAMGARIDATADGWRIEGVQTLNGAAIATRHDHRIAMAHAVAELRSASPIQLDDPAVAAVSYPSFLTDLRKQVIS
jgi:3-phosphoshikimate 1-carboxyvinyltransferase